MQRKNLEQVGIKPAVLLTAALAIVSTEVNACGTEAYLGQVCIMATTFCPQGTLEAAGQLLPITSYQALYSLMGPTYGGDGRTTFALPDLRGRAPVGQGQGQGLSPHNPGDKFGSETVTQTAAQMPIHSHAAIFTPSGGGTGGTASGTVSLPVTGSAKIATATVPSTRSNTPSNNSVLVPAQMAGANIYGAPGTATDLTIGSDGAVTGTASGAVSLTVTGGSSGGTVTVANNGGGQAMTNVPPEIAMRYCIVTEGYYPQRP